MKTHKFTLILSRDPSEVDPLEAAIRSALADTNAAGLSTARVEFEPAAVSLG